MKTIKEENENNSVFTSSSQFRQNQQIDFEDFDLNLDSSSERFNHQSKQDLRSSNPTTSKELRIN